METIETMVIILLGLVAGAIVVAMWEWGKRRARKESPAGLGADVVADSIAAMVVDHFGTRIDKLRDIEALTDRKVQLEGELAQLRREKEEIELTFGQKERTLEHAAGLLRKELDQELSAAKAQADHSAERRILEAERKFNKEQMEFAEKRFEGELKTLNSLVETLTERLPDVSARMKLDGKV